MKLRSLFSLSVVVAMSACSSSVQRSMEEQRAERERFNVVGVKADVPPGVGRFCWREPKVVHEENGPGLNELGTFYHPAYTAVREVKMGYWVECDTGKRVNLQ